MKSKIAGAIPLKRLGTPEDMAQAIVYLSSPAAAYMYGASVNLTGGVLFQ